MPRYIAVILAILFWAWSFIQKKIVGPIDSDEVFFAHILWLVNNGARQYVDFYSYHLPTYFAIWKAVNPLYDTASLQVVWVVRLAGIGVAGAYLWIAWRAMRGDLERFFPAVALMLAYFVLGRMIEVRTDTFGLLLFNAAWVLLLVSRAPRAMLCSAALAVLALTFSARAGIIAVGFAATLLWLIVRRRDWPTLGGLSALGVAILALLGAIYAINPEWSTLVIRSTYLNPLSVTGRVSVWDRFVALDRSVLVAIISAGGWAGVRMGGERGIVLCGAALTQLALIIVDPSPFQYVYGWTALPMVIGVASLAPSLSGIAAFGVSLLWLSLSIAYVGAKGHQPPTLSSLRLTLDPPIGNLDGMSTPALVGRMIDRVGGENLWNDLAVRQEVCRRVGGKVLAGFPSNPVCLHDANFYWTEPTWPAWAVAINTTGVLSRDQFSANFRDYPPSLFIWRSQFDEPPQLDLAIRQVLDERYAVYDGFALLR